MKCRHTSTNPWCFVPFKRLNGKEWKQENGNDGVKCHRSWQWSNESHINRFDVCLCDLKYALFLSYFPHGFSFSPFFIHVIYIISCKQNILKLSNFPNGLFVCSISFSANWLLFLMVMSWLSLSLRLGVCEYDEIFY